jgi:hypothetical protein
MARAPFLCAAILTAAAATAASASEPAPAGLVLRVEAPADAHVRQGTAFLVHRDAGARAPVLYFVTSARVVDGAHGARLFTPAGRAIDVAADDIVLPGADIAILRVRTTDVEGEPVALTTSAPAQHDVFVLVGQAEAGPPRVVAQRVAFVSSQFVIGDRASADSDAFLGAPAFTEAGVFGFVSEWLPGQLPVIALMSPAVEVLARHVPGWTARPAPAPLFQLEHRDVKGPILQVGCDAVESGEVEVPVTLGPRETPVGAAAALVSPAALRLADVTVLDLHGQWVKLRFTMVGTPPPAFPASWPPRFPPSSPATCAGGQALVSVTVDVVVFPKEK